MSSYTSNTNEYSSANVDTTNPTWGSTITNPTWSSTTMDVTDPNYDASNTSYAVESSTDYNAAQPSTFTMANPTPSRTYNRGYNEGYNDAMNTTSTGINRTLSSPYEEADYSAYDDTPYSSSEVPVNTGATGAGSLGNRTGLTDVYGTQSGTSSGFGQGVSVSSKPGTGGWKGAAKRMASRF